MKTEKDCKKIDMVNKLIANLDDTNDISDGYHTFGELYHHRALLFASLCNMNNLYFWKSEKHADGTMYPNMFIVGMSTPYGNATYHYDIDPYWDLFNCKILDNAPEFDGHTPDDAIRRIYTATMLMKNNMKK